MECTTSTAILHDEIPTELRDRPQWVCWREVLRDGRPNKVPYATNGIEASSTDQTTWTTFSVVTTAYERGGYSGIGYVFSASDPFIGIDLDGCRDPESGTIDQWAKEIIDACDTYAEVSPSGTGVKLIGVGRSPFEKGKNQKLPQHGERGGKAAGIEVYDHGRYFTVTGWRLPETDREPCRIQPSALERIKKLIDETKAATRTTSTTSTTATARTATRSTIHDRTKLVERCRKYIDKKPAAISQQGGHGTTYNVACTCFKFGLTDGEALEVLGEYNARCEPPWSDWELQHKLTDARDTVTREGTFGSMSRDDWSGGPAADLSGIMGQVTSGAQATSDEHIDDDDAEPLDAPAGPFPVECLRPEGLLAEIVDYNLATAIVPQPELALAGALALFATVSGRKVRDKRNTRTNLYVLGVDRTANGKEHARSVNKSLMSAAGADGMLGGERIASHAGIVSAVHDSPACLLQLDEMGRFLATTKEAGKSPHLYAVPTLLLELFTSSGTLWKADSYANKDRNKVINQPHLCLYGTSTPSTFWGNLSTSNIRDGLIGRFSVFEGRGDKSEYRPDTDATRLIPTTLIDALKCWVNYRSLGNLSDTNPDPRIVPYALEADRRWQDHARQIFERRKTEPEMRSDLWGRTAEKTAKLALIAACSRAGIDVQEITLADVEWAIRLSNWTTRNVIAKCLEEVSENAQEGKVKRMLRSIGPTGLSLSAFNRLNRFLPSRERDEILRDLIGNGDVVIQEKATKGRKRQILFRGGRRS